MESSPARAKMTPPYDEDSTSPTLFRSVATAETAGAAGDGGWRCTVATVDDERKGGAALRKFAEVKRGSDAEREFSTCGR